MVDEFEYQALLMEMHLLRAMNRMLDQQIARLKTELKHPAGKGRPRNDKR